MQAAEFILKSYNEELADIRAAIKEAKTELKQLEFEKKQSLEVINSINNIGGLQLCKHAFLKETDIVNKSRELVPLVGIYFLIQDDEIVYIGQAVDIYRRISQHQYDKEKMFNRYAFIVCKTHELDIIETLYIHHFLPKYNSQSSVEAHQFGKGSGNKFIKGVPFSLGKIIEVCSMGLCNEKS